MFFKVYLSMHTMIVMRPPIFVNSLNIFGSNGALRCQTLDSVNKVCTLLRTKILNHHLRGPRIDYFIQMLDKHFEHAQFDTT